MSLLCPAISLPVSLDGVEEGDFTMVMGYPANTSEYVISSEIAELLNKTYPKKIALRTTRLEVMRKYMDEDDNVRIQYASKYRGVSNAWKKWKGVVWGLDRMNAVEIKKDRERIFKEWTESSPSLARQYENIIPSLYQVYSDLEKYDLVIDYATEAVMVPEIFNITVDVLRLLNSNAHQSKSDKIAARDEFFKVVDSFFKNYYEPIDKDITTAMLKDYGKNIDKEFHPSFYRKIQRKYKGDFNRYISEMFRNTLFNTSEEVHDLLNDYPEKEKKFWQRFTVIRRLRFIRTFPKFTTTGFIIPMTC